MKVSLGYFSCIIIILFIIVSGEYYIGDKVPSYMYKHFNTVTEEIFPSDIRINISLSYRYYTTLLYSIDKNRNQLIMSLGDIIVPKIIIKFRNQSHFITLPKLCGCKVCWYETLKLQIKINSKLVIQCNDKESHYLVYNNNKDVDKDYSQPHFNNNTKSNEAHLYIGNNNYKVYQLRGCIFNVLYKDKEIEFTTLNGTEAKQCRRTCIGDICNGGQCYEDYNEGPDCDCTKTFLSGEYCNDSAVSINIQSSYRLLFWRDMLKVSWKSHSKDLLSLNNSNSDIRLSVDSSKLIFQYKDTNKQMKNEKIILTCNYVQNEEHILILNFVENTLEFYNNKYWLKKTLPTNLSFERGILTLTLQSCEGYIDLFRKDIYDVVLRKEDIEYGTQIKNNKSATCSKNPEIQKELINQLQKTFFLGLFIFLVVVALSVLICLVLVIRVMLSIKIR